MYKNKCTFIVAELKYFPDWFCFSFLCAVYLVFSIRSNTYHEEFLFQEVNYFSDRFWQSETGQESYSLVLRSFAFFVCIRLHNIIGMILLHHCQFGLSNFAGVYTYKFWMLGRSRVRPTISDRNNLLNFSLLVVQYGVIIL